MKRFKIKTITAVLVGLTLFQGMALADSDDIFQDHDHDDHGNSSSDHGIGWALVAALVITGGVLLYRFGRGEKTAEASSKPLLPATSDARIRMAILSSGSGGTREADEISTSLREETKESVQLAFAVRF